MPRLVLSLVLALAAGPALAGPLTCGANFKKSCVRKLYRCFDEAGTCSRDTDLLFVDGTVTDCWANGARARLGGFTGGGGTSSLIDSRGRECLTGTTVVDPDCTVHVRYTRKRRVWEITRTPAGTFIIACPNGRTEQYDASQIATGGCGPIADCAAGSCP